MFLGRAARQFYAMDILAGIAGSDSNENVEDIGVKDNGDYCLGASVARDNVVGFLFWTGCEDWPNAVRFTSKFDAGGTNFQQARLFAIYKGR